MSESVECPPKNLTPRSRRLRLFMGIIAITAILLLLLLHTHSTTHVNSVHLNVISTPTNGFTAVPRDIHIMTDSITIQSQLQQDTFPNFELIANEEYYQYDSEYEGHNPLETIAPTNILIRRKRIKQNHALIKEYIKRPPPRHQFHANPSLSRIKGIKSVKQPISTSFELNLSANMSYTDYQYQTYYDIRSNITQICDYLSVHGLPKSGTTWLEYILNTISNHACSKSGYNDLSICKSNHIGHWDKHIAIKAMDREVNNTRYCVLVVFRDLRDRLSSYIHYHYRDINDERFEMLQEHAKDNINSFSKEIKRWFNFYGNLEHKQPLNYFNYFYEDLLLNTEFIIKRIVNFIGLNDVLNGNDIQNITRFVEWNTLKENNVNTAMSKRNWRNYTNGGTICQINNEFSTDTLQYIHDTIYRQKIQRELLRKFNETCPFPLFVFETTLTATSR